jgi:hypothetical protein
LLGVTFIKYRHAVTQETSPADSCGPIQIPGDVFGPDRSVAYQSYSVKERVMSSTELDPVVGMLQEEKAPTQRSQRSSLALDGARAVSTRLGTGATATGEVATIIAQKSHPAVRTIETKDLKAALAMGFEDFMAIPTHVMFLSIIYPIVAFMLARITLKSDVVPLLFPLIAGFSLIGPFAAIGLYELSRRRERAPPSTVRQRPRPFPPGRSAPYHDKGHQPTTLFGIILVLCPFEGDQDLSA